MVSFEEATTAEITEILKTYMDPQFYVLNDFDKVISRAEVNTERNVVCFHLALLDLYLDTRDLEYVDACPYNQVDDIHD
ncbi:MAG: hypothetical protein ACI4VJ_05430 [Methanosphaera sp.]